MTTFTKSKGYKIMHNKRQSYTLIFQTTAQIVPIINTGRRLIYPIGDAIRRSSFSLASHHLKPIVDD